MTGIGWSLVLGLAILAVYLGWRWRRAEAERQRLAVRERTTGDALRDLADAHARLSRQFQAVASVSAEGIFLLDQGERVVWMNDAARSLSSPDIILPQPLSRLAPSHETLPVVQKTFVDGGPHERQFISDGSAYLAVARRIFSSPPLVALTISDVTELLRLGRARRDFLANISHDLRTPIAAIQLMVETLRSEGISENRRKKLLASIYEQTNSLQQLTREMLDLSMIESGRMPLKLVETSLAMLIGPICQRMAAQVEPKHIILTTDYAPDLRVWADVNHVQRVLQNLLHNAIKYTPEQGRIGVRSDVRGDEVVIAVADTGVGVAPGDIDHVFERFYKSDQMRSGEGTGLGLAIARHIVMGHGGRIWVESEPGQGATFFFTLPRV